MGYSAQRSAKLRNKLTTAGVFPRQHAFAIGLLVAVLLALLVAYPSDEIPATPKAEQDAFTHAAIVIEEAPLPAAPPEIPWQPLRVEPGDTLSHLFARAGLNDNQMYKLLDSTPDAKVLTRLYPGQIVDFRLDEQGLLALRLVKSPLEQLIFQRTESGFEAEQIVREPDIKIAHRQAQLNDNLFLAAQRAGLPENLIMEMANIFGGVIDFVYDPRPGDTFNIMFEEHYLDGVKLDEGNILAASYTNEGKTFTAYRYTDPGGEVGYYNPGGESMRKAFLRAPLDFTRISSGFNPKRLHPVFKTTRPHRGVDYAAARGTPVFSTGDGRVQSAGYSKANGNFVFIQHGQAYVTKYLHLHKRHVKQGQRVKQGQIIGKVGSTGYATGPHLHYEFLVNGVHRNPRTILNKLPKAKSVPAADKQHFFASIRPLEEKFAAYRNGQQPQYASQDTPVPSRGT
jgi:murein DD-endopeptidase MepM/ murein hydrolase activator NlpD